MKSFFSKTYRFGKISVSIIVDEFIFIYRGRNRAYIKKVCRRDVFTPFKKKVYISCMVLLISSLSLLFIQDTDEKKIDLSDTEKKNMLLLSKVTDFSEPKKYVELKISKHIVKKGETLSQIAKKYGVSIDTICGCSNLRSYHMISIGKILNIPNKDGILHKLKKGQKLVKIAQKYKVSVKKIIAENNIKNPDFFPPNELIFIPDAKPLNIMPGFLWPAMSRRITCGYGWRRNPFNRRAREFHQGLDIKSNYQWVRSTKYGKVTYTGWLGGYGRAIIIAHPGGWKSLYGHLSRIIVRRGQYVRQGQSIAKSGNTGRSTGAHLHFELLRNGRHRNPYTYLKKKR